jgi:glycosyltransferase involved in cell wall biosynthesis
MRIIFVNSARDPAGGVTSAIELASGLAQLGYELTVVCHPRSAIRRALEHEPRLALAPVAIRAELNPLRALQLARLSRRVRPDVVLADRRKDVKLSVAARYLSGAAYPIVHRHGAPSHLKDSALYRFVWGRQVQALIVNSRTMGERLLERAPWLASVDMRVIQNGKDLALYRPLPERRRAAREALAIPERALVVSYHGVLQPRKNVHLLIEAAAALAPDLPVHALVIGAGPSEAELRALTARLRAQATFTGLRSDIPELLSAADIAAHLSTAEGFSNSVIEAMACGLPVIASDATSHPEQIVHGVHGLLVAPGEGGGPGGGGGGAGAVRVAEAIRTLATDPAARARMGRAARERAVAEYDREKMLRRYSEVLEEAIATYRARRAASASSNRA